MEKYVKPIVIENEDMFEGVFANYGSGSEEPPNGSAEVYWRNHNSGSHSDLECLVHVGATGASRVEVHLKWIGNGNITSVGGYGGPYTTAYAANNEVVFIREGQNINPNENFGFSFGQVVFDSTGDNHVDPKHVGSYFEGQGNGYLGIADQFIIDLKIT